ncbi:TPA: hypothetical protein ACOVFI_003860 [Citrobacter braakii]
MAIKLVFKLLMLACLTLSPLALVTYLDYQKDHFSCQASVDITKNDYSLESIMSFHFDGGKGLLSSKGILKRGGSEITRINKKLAFNYWKEDKTMIFISTNDYDNDANIELLNSLAPDFFLYSDRGISIELKRLNESSYLFTQSGTPLFTCVITAI